MSTKVGGSPAGARGAPTRGAELALGGMTCASCAARIEKKLNKLDGVTAAVNFATATAQVTLTARLTTADLIHVIEKAGYTAALPTLRDHASARVASGEDGAGNADMLRRRLLVSLARRARRRRHHQAHLGRGDRPAARHGAAAGAPRPATTSVPPAPSQARWASAR